MDFAGPGCPAALEDHWDAPTLASFSVPQIDGLAQILRGGCPLLSRTVKCKHHGGMFDSFEEKRRKHLLAAYLAEEAELSRRWVLQMMRHAWRNYERHAWGADEILPLTGKGIDNWGTLGQSLVDSLDTLYIMGLHDEFNRALHWVETSLNFNKDLNVNLFETSIRQFGGLLSAFALSGKRKLLDKAKDLGKRLKRAFEVPHESTEPVKPAMMKSSLNDGVLEMMKQWGFSEQDLLSNLEVYNKAHGIGKHKGKRKGKNKAAKKEKGLPPPFLPYSDINLLTGEGQSLAAFVSLAEAYTPVEWKALAMLTGNCSHVEDVDRVLSVVNHTTQLMEQGVAPIMLSQDGKAFGSPENRISMGSRGDSFYEYLLKDWIMTGKESGTLARRLYDRFIEALDGLLVTVPNRPQPEGFRQLSQRKRKRLRPDWKRRKEINRDRAEAQKKRKPWPTWPQRPRGGWYEGASDVDFWVFLKEVTWFQSINKMDHLVCFLPGVLALDVYHRRPSAQNLTGTPKDVLASLHVGHKLLQTCVHMYFRTKSGLAPEITRFDGHGLIDDKGSMHHILRPETIESVMIFWRTTKAQIYRNWGQRMLAAFAGAWTPYGFASLENVNRPNDRRDSMPSFFLAETMKYLYLLFTDDSVLPLSSVVFSTEAHPLPILNVSTGRWPCKTNAYDAKLVQFPSEVLEPDEDSEQLGDDQLEPEPLQMSCESFQCSSENSVKNKTADDHMCAGDDECNTVCCQGDSSRDMFDGTLNAAGDGLHDTDEGGRVAVVQTTPSDTAPAVRSNTKQMKGKGKRAQISPEVEKSLQRLKTRIENLDFNYNRIDDELRDLRVALLAREVAVEKDRVASDEIVKNLQEQVEAAQKMKGKGKGKPTEVQYAKNRCEAYLQDLKDRQKLFQDRQKLDSDALHKCTVELQTCRDFREDCKGLLEKCRDEVKLIEDNQKLESDTQSQPKDVKTFHARATKCEQHLKSALSKLEKHISWPAAENGEGVSSASHRHLAEPSSPKPLGGLSSVPATPLQMRAALHGAAAFKYLGCFQDQLLDPDFSVQAPEIMSNAADCASFCDDFKYFGLRRAGECFCGNVFGRHGHANCINQDCEMCSRYAAHDLDDGEILPDTANCVFSAVRDGGIALLDSSEGHDIVDGSIAAPQNSTCPGASHACACSAIEVAQIPTTPESGPVETKEAKGTPEVKGNPECWSAGFSFEACCWDPPKGNPACWDTVFTFELCCTTAR